MKQLEGLLLSDYGIKAMDIEVISTGVLNRNFVVAAERGQRFVLKLYTPDIYSQSAVDRACTYQMDCREHGIPVPELVLNKAGNWQTVCNGHSCVVSKFIDGEQYQRPQLPPRAAFAMGQTLGELHRVMQSFPDVLPYRLPTPEEALTRLWRLLKLAEPHRYRSTVDEWACQTLANKIHSVEHMQTAAPAALDTQWIHGDYQETNLLFSLSGSVAAVLDFDNVRCRPRGFEVMRCLAYVLFTDSGPVPEAEDYLRGYFNVVRPPEPEILTYAPLWQYFSLVQDWPIGARYEAPETYQSRWDAFITPPSSWWEEHVGKISEWLLATWAKGAYAL